VKVDDIFLTLMVIVVIGVLLGDCFA